MSSRSIGVTNVWFSRWMMSCVIRSPSCSQIRMSRASSLRSGYVVQHLLEQPGRAQDVAAGLLEEVEELAVARGEDAGQAHRVGTLALNPRRTGQAPSGVPAVPRPALAPQPRTPASRTPPDAARGALAVDHRVRGPVVAVHGIPTLPGLISSMPPGPWRVNARCVCPKTTRSRLDAHQELGVRLRGLGEEALHVRLRRGVAVERAVDRRGLRKAAQLGHKLLAERSAQRCDRDRPPRAHPGGRRASGRRCRGSRSRRRARLSRSTVSRGQAPKPCVVAAEQEAVDALGVGQHRLESGQVAVDVVEQRKHDLHATRQTFGLPPNRNAWC